MCRTPGAAAGAGADVCYRRLTPRRHSPILRAMPTPNAFFTLVAQSMPRVGAALLSVVFLTNHVALASPTETADPMTRFLADKGLIAAPEATPSTNGADAVDPIANFARVPAPSLVQQMRDGASDMVLTAMNFLGVPYKRGGNTEETGFDCSGFTRYIFEKTLGLVLPRRADEQAQSTSLLSIAREELKPGDLVFFNTLRRTFSHVGIYLGEGKFIHAPRAGALVRVEDMRVAYWNQRFTGARRAPQMQAAPAAAAVPEAITKPAIQATPSVYSGSNY
jgi:cell wall-associated NlpC family hydrolase